MKAMVVVCLVGLLGCGGSATTDAPGQIDAPLPDAKPPKLVRFITLGDTGKGNADQRRVAVAARDLCAARGCDFALLLGDNIYEEGVETIDDPIW